MNQEYPTADQVKERINRLKGRPSSSSTGTAPAAFQFDPDQPLRLPGKNDKGK